MTSQKTIVIVEDNPMNMMMVEDLLQISGYRTLTAQDAVTGIELVRQNRPDLVLMDMYLPVTNGYEATKALKADPETAHIPIVAFTALAMSDEREKAKASGCIGIITKPIEVDSFARTISGYLKTPC